MSTVYRRVTPDYVQVPLPTRSGESSGRVTVRRAVWLVVAGVLVVYAAAAKAQVVRPRSLGK